MLAGSWSMIITSEINPDDEVTGQIAPDARSVSFNWRFLADVPKAFNKEVNGGLGPSIQGTLIVIGLASLASVPIGILTGIYLSEFAGNSKFPTTLRLVNDVLTGMPSIVVGLLAFLTLVLALGTFSILAGAFALSIIMTPIIVRVTE